MSVATSFGMRRNTESDREYYHVWTETADAEDMLLGDTLFRPFPAGEDPTEQDVTAALAPLYAGLGGQQIHVSRTYSYIGGRHTFQALTFVLPIFNPGDEELTSLMVRRAAALGRPFLIRAYRSAHKAMRRVYQSSAYDTAPLVAKAVQDDLILVTPSAHAPARRVGRQKAAATRAERKQKEIREKEKVDQDRWAKAAKVRRVNDAMKSLIKTLLAKTPAVNACFDVEGMYSMYQPETVTKGRKRDRHWGCGLRASLALYQRAAPKTGAVHWTKYHEAKEFVTAWIESDGLMGTKEADETHEDDAPDLAWLDALVKRSAKAAGYVKPKPPKLPKPTKTTKTTKPQLAKK